MNRTEVLDRAKECVCRERVATHGPAEARFRAVAALWSTDLGIEITAVRVARLMCLFKLVRAAGNPDHADNWIDIAGYAALGAELAAGGGALSDVASLLAPSGADPSGAAASPAAPGRAPAVSPLADECGDAGSDGCDPKRRWTEEDKTAAWRRYLDGETPKSIAAALERDHLRVANLIHGMKRGSIRRPASAAALAPQSAPEAATMAAAEVTCGGPGAAGGAEAADPDPAPDNVEVMPGASDGEEAGATDPDAGWTPELDYALAEGICTAGFKPTCARLGLKPAAAMARWNRLLPKKGLDEQRRLLARLKARAGAEEGRDRSAATAGAPGDGGGAA